VGPFLKSARILGQLYLLLPLSADSATVWLASYHLLSLLSILW